MPRLRGDSAICAVSWSRISPTRITSGSCLRPDLEPVGEGENVPPDFALRHHRVGRLRIQVFDRLLDGDDAVTARLVEQIDDHRQGGGLPRAGHARDDDQPVTRLGPAGRASSSGNPAQAKSGMVFGYQPQARTDVAARREKVDAEPGDPTVRHHMRTRNRSSSGPERPWAAAGQSAVSSAASSAQGRLGQFDQVAVQAQDGG